MDRNIVYGLLAASLAGVVFAQDEIAGEQSAQVAKDGTSLQSEMQPAADGRERAPAVWSFRGGPTWNFGTKLRGSWNPDSLRGLVTAKPRKSSAASSAAIAPATGFADRDYVDGYVHMDEGTADPETMEYGTTWNWGYRDSSQYDGSTAVFHTPVAESSSSVKSLAVPGADDEKDLRMSGIDVQARRDFGKVAGDVELGVALGFRLYDREDAKFGNDADLARESYSQVSYADHYDAHWEGFPSAPYSQGIDGPGYLLDNVPLYRTASSSGSSKAWSASSRAEVEFERMDFRIGPAFAFFFWRDRIIAELQPQVVLARTELDVESDTVVMAGRSVKAHVHERVSSDEWIFGGGIEASVTCGLPWGVTLSISGAYDAWCDDVKASAGPYDVKAELGDWTLACAIGKEF